MKFKIKQEKFQELLEKLLLKDVFPSSIIATKNGILFSIQKEEHGRALRYVKFNKIYFDEIDNSVESIEIDVEKALHVLKNISADTPLIIETKGNKLSIQRLIVDKDGKVIDIKGITMLAFKEPQGPINEQIPFEIKESVPYVGEGKVALSTYFTVDLSELKSMTAFGSSLKTEFYKFMFEQKETKPNKEIAVRIGGIHDFNDYDTSYPKGEIKTPGDLAVTFTYGLPQIADTFRQKEVNFRTKTDCPGWIYEGNESYLLGVLIPPYVLD